MVIHEYVALDLDRVVEALRRLDPIEQFIAIVRDIEAAESVALLAPPPRSPSQYKRDRCARLVARAGD